MKLFEHQKRAVNFMLKLKSSLLFFDMGAGKTLIVLTWLWLKREKFKKILIIGPKWVILNTWPSEIKKWGVKFDFTILVGKKAQREKNLKKEAKIYLINHDNLPWLLNETEWQYDCVIVDELSLFANHKAIKFRGSGQKAKNTRKLGLKDMKYKYFIGMTGTPKNYDSLWPMVYLADKGARLGPNITTYRNTFYNSYKTDFGRNYELAPGKDKVIDEKIKDIAIALPDVNFKPKVILNDIYVDIDRKQYNKFKRDYILKTDDIKINAANAGVLSGKLRQLANGRVYDEYGETHIIHNEKLDALEGLIDQNGDNPILVFINFKHDMESIMKRFVNASTIKDPKDIEDWNARKIPLLVVHPASCGHGLNLQNGGSIAVWYGLTWNLEHYLQANARLARPGQKEIVTINRIMARDSIDFLMAQRLDDKKVTQDAIIEAVKLCL